MPHTHSLPLTPAPREDELTPAYLDRVASANLLTLNQLQLALGSVGRVSTSAGPFSLRDEKEALERMLDFLGRPTLADAPTRVFDLAPYSQSSARFKQVCPACLRDDKTIVHGLAEPSWAVCLEHGFAHITSCPHCQAPLRWGDGSYFECACGFDLRRGPTLRVSQECLALVLSAAANVKSFVEPPLPDGRDVAGIRNRLPTTFQYLAGGLGLPEVRSLPRPATGISPYVPLWENISKVVCPLATELRSTVIGIEARLMYVPKSQAAHIVNSHRRRSMIEWGLLASCAHDATQLDPRLRDIARGRPLGMTPEAAAAFRLISTRNISTALQSALHTELRQCLTKRGETASGRDHKIAAITELAGQLLHVGRPDWLKQTIFTHIAEVFSFVACGVLTPWHPSFVRSWHVLVDDVKRVEESFRFMRYGSSDDRALNYTVPYSSIFDERAPAAEWLALSTIDAKRLIGELVPAWKDFERRQSGGAINQTIRRMPAGFGYFIPSRWIRYISGFSDNKLRASTIFAPDGEDLKEALFEAFQAGRNHFGTLGDWELDAAQASQRILADWRPPTDPTRSTAATQASLDFRSVVGDSTFSNALGEFGKSRRAGIH